MYGTMSLSLTSSGVCSSIQVPPFKQIKSKHGSGTAKRFIYLVNTGKLYIKHERCVLTTFSHTEMKVEYTTASRVCLMIFDEFGKNYLK